MFKNHKKRKNVKKRVDKFPDTPPEDLRESPDIPVYKARIELEMVLQEKGKSIEHLEKNLMKAG